jgi:hypothetical protein
MENDKVGKEMAKIDNAIEILIDHDATKGGGAKEDGWILLSSSQDLNSQLACAPYAISVLSTVNLFAAEGIDFELVAKEDLRKYDLETKKFKDQFKHLKFPTSFRATISNLSNEACNAFIRADSSMHRIMLTMKQVPKHVEGAMKVMVQGQGEDIAMFLPIHLKFIQSDAQKCKTEAKLVLDSFDNVSAILNDLTEAIILQKGKSENKAKEALEEIEKLKKKNEDIKEDEKRNREEYQETVTEFKRRTDLLDKELDHQGSWGQVFKEGFKSAIVLPFETLTKSPAAMLNAATSFFKAQTSQVTIVGYFISTVGAAYWDHG